MIYLDNGATSFPKPPQVIRAVNQAMMRCGNPGRGGHSAAMASAKVLYRGREVCANFFDCDPEQVVFTSNCTHGLNIAIRSLVKQSDRVVISGFEHNAVVRPLYGLGAQILKAGSRLFDWDNTLEEFENCLQKGVKAAIFTHISNVFGYILPVEQMADLCKIYGVPFVLDSAQSAGVLDVKLKKLGANYIAMPGHKGLMGPMGTGVLLCGDLPQPLMYGGTGSVSASKEMPDFLPDRAEPGTINVPGIAGLCAGIRYVQSIGTDKICSHEMMLASRFAAGLKELGYQVFAGKEQTSVISFRGKSDCEEIAKLLDEKQIAVRSGLHCAPCAHQTAGTFDTGTVRVSFGPGNTMEDVRQILWILADNREKIL